MLNERCWILKGKVKGKFWIAHKQKMTVGNPTNVKFDPYYVLKNEEQVIGFIHTHPSFKAIPSSTDYETMDAWCFSLGKKLLCAIDGIDGLRAYWFNNNDQKPIESKIEKIGKFYVGSVPEDYVCLKASSYNDALEQAKVKEKNIILWFPLLNRKKFKNKIFKKSYFKDSLGSYVNYVVNRNEHEMLIRKFGIQSIPSCCVLDFKENRVFLGKPEEFFVLLGEHNEK